MIVCDLCKSFTCCISIDSEWALKPVTAQLIVSNEEALLHGLILLINDLKVWVWNTSKLIIWVFRAVVIVGVESLDAQLVTESFPSKHALAVFSSCSSDQREVCRILIHDPRSSGWSEGLHICVHYVEQILNRCKCRIKDWACESRWINCHELEPFHHRASSWVELPFDCIESCRVNGRSFHK